jgi:Polyketide synthase dehydratase/KR domain
VTFQREIASTIDRVNQLGGEAIYWSTDITNKVQLATDLKTIESSFGKITGLIHGAGNLADKRIEKKTLVDWNDVFGSKIIGLKSLLSVLDLNDLQQIILFSSVAGYFGNAGQTDYALANEILNKFAYSCQALYPKMQVVSINWGPWERGMMNPILQKYYQEQGIDLIPVTIGAEFCQQELSIAKACQTPQVVISGSLSIPANYTLQQQQADTFDRYLSVQNNPFLEDHRVGNDAVLPMTCAIDWMVKACEDRLPNYKIGSVSNFQVLKGIRFTPDSNLDYTLDIKPLNKEQDGFEYEIQIDSFCQDNGRQLHHYKGMVVLSKQWEAPPIYPNLNLDLSLDSQIESLYGERNCLFHGPTFQGVQQVLSMSDRAIVSQCRLPSISLEQQGQFAVNSFNPYIADVQLHNVLIWAYHYLKQGCLPTKVEQIEQFCDIDFDKDFYVSTEIIESSKSQIVVDIFAHDLQGNILMKWHRVSYITMKKLTTLFWGGEV